MATALSFTESQIFAATRAVLQAFGLVSSSPGAQVPIIRGQTNRVPEPSLTDFVVMWPIRRDRLATDIDTYLDTVIVGSIAANVLNVTQVVRGAPATGQTIFSLGAGAIGTITAQSGGTPNGVGTYKSTPTANIGSQSLYLGTVSLWQPVDCVIQLDVHGPASADNAHIISTLIRDYVGVAAYAAQMPGLVPLYADDPKQIPFVNAEKQWEERWVVDLHLQADPVVTVAQQFAAQLRVTTVSVEAISSSEGFWNDAGALAVFTATGLPFVPLGLPAGTIWANGLSVAIIPGATPIPSAPLFFGTVTPAQLQAAGGASLPTSDPAVHNQLWNNGNLVTVSP